MNGCAFRSLLPSDDEPSGTGPTVIPDHTDTNSPPNSNGDTEEAPTLPSYYDPLTGLGSEVDLSALRPVSFCFGTDKTLGLSAAKILIEAPIAGGGTRLCAITNTYASLSAIGGIQTTRPYLFSLSSLFSAVSVHAGCIGATGARPSIDYTDSGMGTVFYRNPSYATNDLFTSGTRLVGAMESFFKEGGTLPFSLVPYGESATLNGIGAKSVILPFSADQIAQFTYNSDTGEYLRRQNSLSHVDEANGEQLAFTNLLLLVCESSIYNKVSGTELDLNVTGGGSGYYVTGGKATCISWSQSDGKLLLIDGNGKEIACNRGKTYIGLIDITNASSVMIID